MFVINATDHLEIIEFISISYSLAFTEMNNPIS
jgi:hypothetical protein